MKPVAGLLAIFCSFASFAQKKTFPGFYVTLQGDTVKGIFTDYNGWEKNPSLVEFTPAGAKPIVLGPTNCSAFAIEGYDAYIAYAGNRLLNPIEEGEVIQSKNILSPNDQYGEVRIFLREVVKSPQVNLYVLNDNTRTNFFYKLPGRSLVELKYKRFFAQAKIVDSAIYRQQINDLFRDEIGRRSLSAELESLPYKEESMTAFFGKLFSVQKVVRKSKNPTLGWIASAGVSYNFLNVSGDASLDAVGKSYDASLSPLLSIGYLKPIGETFGRYFIYPHLNVYAFKNTGENTDQRFRKVNTFQSDAVLNAALNVGMHLVNEENFRFFISVGAGGMLLINNKETDTRYELSNNTLFSVSETKLSSISYTINVTPGIILKNRIVLLATYAVPTPVAYYSYLKPHHSGIQATLGYKFK